MPWAMRSPKGVVAAYSASRWTGLVSPLTWAKATRSASVTVWAVSALSPIFRSSKNIAQS
jgi:hypothetical protein